MDMKLIDTHAHLDQSEFDHDREEVIVRAAQSGVTAIVTVGVTAASSLDAVELASRQEPIFAAVGLQPNYCGQAEADDWNRVLELLARPKVVAIGESGLDGYWDYTPFKIQKDYFDRHLRAAQEHDLPIIIHTRDSDDAVLEMLREARRRGPLRGVMHSFTGDAETAAECVELGLHISFAGMATFKKSESLRAVAATIPAERLLVETDSPYLAPHPHRGKRNEPAYVRHTLEALAGARGVSAEELAAVTSRNACDLFRI
jgi:TatD DNase family protein